MNEVNVCAQKCTYNQSLRHLKPRQKGKVMVLSEDMLYLIDFSMTVCTVGSAYNIHGYKGQPVIVAI